MDVAVIQAGGLASHRCSTCFCLQDMTGDEQWIKLGVKAGSTAGSKRTWDSAGWTRANGLRVKSEYLACEFREVLLSSDSSLHTSGFNMAREQKHDFP